MDFKFLLTLALALESCCEEKSKKRKRSADLSEDKAWQAQIKTWRSALKAPASAQPFDCIGKPIQGHEHPTERERAILNCVVLQQMARKGLALGSKNKRCIQECVATTLVDLSQNPCRRSFTSRENCNHALTTGTELVHLGEWRRVVGREHLYLQGHSRSTVVPWDMSDRSLRNLAGEGIALPCLAVCLVAQLLLSTARSARASLDCS